MNKIVLLMLVGMATAILLVPFIPMDRDLVRADVYVSEESMLLKGSGGQVELPVPGDDLYSSDDPFDFFPELIDPSSIQRVELLPYGEGISCNVLTSTGKRIAGDVDFCIVLTLKLNIPVYVHKDLFEVPESLVTGNLLV